MTAKNVLGRILPFLCVALLITVAIVVTYSDFIFRPDPRDLLGCGDHWLYCGPHAYFMDYALHHGELPLWNPLVECGKPHAANPQSVLFYPPNLLRSVLTFHPTPMKTHISLAILIFLHALMAGVGTYYLARAHGLSAQASFAAGFIYLFNGNFVSVSLMHWTFIAMVAWLPVILLLVRKAITETDWRPSVNYSLLAGVCFGCSILAGFPQMTFYMGVLIAAYVLLLPFLHEFPKKTPVRATEDEESVPVDPHEDSTLTRFGRASLTLVLTCTIAVLLAAAMLLPATELAQFGAREKGNSLATTYEPAYQHGFGELLEYLVTYPGAEDFKDLRLAGAGALLLAMVGLTYRRRKETLLFAALFVILLDCSFGPPSLIARLLEWVAPFRMVQPARAMIVTGLPMALLAAMGVDAATTALDTHSRNLVRSWCLFVVGAAILVCLALWTYPRHRYVDVSPYTALAVPAALLLVIVLAGWFVHQRHWRMLMALLVFGETFVWTPPFIRVVLERWPYSGPVERLYAEHEMSLENRRITSGRTYPRAGQIPDWAEPWNDLMYELRPAINGYEPLFLQQVRRTIVGAWSENVYLRHISSWDVTRSGYRGNLFLKRPFWLARQYARAPLPDRYMPFPSTSTVFLADAPRDLAVPRVPAEDLPKRGVSNEAVSMSLSLPEAITTPVTATTNPAETRLSLPLITLFGQHAVLTLRYHSTGAVKFTPVFIEPESSRSEWGTAFDLQAAVGAEQTLEIPLPDFKTIRTELAIAFSTPDTTFQILAADVWTDPADEDSHLRIESWRANSVTVEVRDLPSHRLLTFLDANYPGWKAFVDDQPTPIYLSNDAFKAVVVPPGTHRIEFIFRPRLVYAGIAVSLLTVAALAAWFVYCRRRATPNVPAGLRTKREM